MRVCFEMILKLLLSEPPLPQYQLSKALPKILLKSMSPKTKTIYYEMCASRRRQFYSWHLQRVEGAKPVVKAWKRGLKWLRC